MNLQETVLKSLFEIDIILTVNIYAFYISTNKKYIIKVTISL